MISRRNIRVKVMQTLYSLHTANPEAFNTTLAKQAKVMLNQKLEQSLELFTTIILYTTSVAQYAETDARQRAAKYLPSQDDLNVSTKIAGNEVVWKVLGNNTFSEKIKESHLERHLDPDWVKKLYQQLVRTETYQTYIAQQQRNPKDELAIYRFIWEGVLKANDSFIEFLSDELPSWEDDAPMLDMLLDNFFKGVNKVNFLSLISGEKQQYAQELLESVLEKDELIMTLIKPKLQNWEAERVALIDLILLRMGVSELLYFPTIPTKVTINEYIDLAKLYSTPQSGQFVNGVLDNLLKELSIEGKIRKNERGMKS
ncbi:MAG: transcription antitermination factor NusB [Bacteroidetes bacterium]|nr:transcription antitermination factor NusB [Bacteroidota bacterium]